MVGHRKLRVLTFTQSASGEGLELTEGDRAWLEKVGRRIRSGRFAKGMTPVELGRLCGLDLQTIDAIEEGQSNPHVAELAAIAAAIGMSLDALART